MKAKAVSLVTIVFFCNFSFAYAFDLEPVVGANQTRPAGSRESNRGYGADGGVFARFEVGPQWELETGLLYFVQKYDLYDSTYKGFVTYTQGTLQVPMMVRYRPVSFVSLGTGIYFDMGIGDITESDTSGVYQMTYDNELLKKTSLGWVLSATAEIPISSDKDLVFDGRYNYGLTNQQVKAAGTVGPDPNLKLNVIHLLVGLKFHVK